MQAEPARPAAVAQQARGLAARASMHAVRTYQRRLSFMTRGWCRFEPSCSQYALEALERHGALRGWGLALWRIARCNPWGGCGHDPVPTTDASSDAERTSSAR